MTVHGLRTYCARTVSSSPRRRSPSVPVRMIRPGIRLSSEETSTVSGSRRIIPNTYSTGVKDTESVRLLTSDLLPMGLELPDIPVLHVDCEPAIAVANGGSTRSRTKNIDFKIWLCRDYVARKLVRLIYVPMNQQIADFFHQADCRAWAVCAV